MGQREIAVATNKAQAKKAKAEAEAKVVAERRLSFAEERAEQRALRRLRHHYA